MSSRGKRVNKVKQELDEKPAWIYCSKCGRKFITTSKHNEICTVVISVESALFVDNNQSGVIHNNTLVANVTTIEKDDGVCMPVDNWDTMYMNPATIRELGGRIFFNPTTPIVINRRFIGYTQPSVDTPLDEVKMSSKFSAVIGSDKHVVMAQIISLASIETAAKVHISSNENVEGDAVQRLLQSTLMKRVVTTGSILSAECLNRVINMKVVKIVPQYGRSFYCDSGSPSAEDGSPQFYKLCHFTKYIQHAERDERRLRNMVKSCAGYDKIRKYLGDKMSAILTGDLDSSERGVLIHGPPGSGKKFLAEVVCHMTPGVEWVDIDVMKIHSRYRRSGQAGVVAMFQNAVRNAEPCVVFIHHVDSMGGLCEERVYYSNVSTAFIAAIDAIFAENRRVFLVASADKLSDVHSELLKENRLAVSHELEELSANERTSMLIRRLSLQSHCLSQSDILKLSEKAHSLCWAWQIAEWCSMAYLTAKRNSSRTDTDAEILPAGTDSLEVRGTGYRTTSGDTGSGDAREAEDRTTSVVSPSCPCISLADMLYSLAKYRRRFAMTSVEQIKWSDIGGCEPLKRMLRQSIEDPISRSGLYKKLNAKSLKGILLYGPPGCSKTMIAKAVANECGYNFFAVQGSELLSCYQGESERNIRELFSKARKNSPAIIFFDEIDAIGVSRGRTGSSNVTGSMMQSLLTELDGVDELSNVIVLAATNRPQSMDKALLRSGRLDRKIYVRLPDDESRRAIFNGEFRRIRTASDVDVDDLVPRSQGFSCAEVVHVVNEALRAAFREYLNSREGEEAVYARHFDIAFTEVTPRTKASALKVYEQFERASKK